MKLLEIAIGTMLRIPDGWQQFTYRGWLYTRGEGGRFVRMAKVGGENSEAYIEKSA